MKKKSREIYNYFLISIIPIMLVPVLLLTVVLYRDMNVFREEVYSKNLTLLQNNARGVENMVESVNTIVSYLQSSIMVNNFLSYDSLNEDGSNTTSVMNLQKDVRSLVTANDLVEDIHLFSYNNQMLLRYASTTVNPDRFYGQSFAIKDMDYEEWYHRILLREDIEYPYFRSYISGTGAVSRRMILYNSNLYNYSTATNNGSVSILLDEHKLVENFRNIEYRDEGYLYIQDARGSVLFEENYTGEEEIYLGADKLVGANGILIQKAGHKNLFTTYYIDSNGWTYVAAVSKQLVEKPVSDNMVFVAAMVLFSLVVGLFLTRVFTVRLSTPIARIYTLLDKKNYEVTYQDFDEVIGELVNENEQMQKELENHIPALKTSVFYTWLAGGYQEKEELRKKLENIGINVDSGCYVVLIVSLNDLDTQNNLSKIAAQKIYLKDILSEHLGSGQIYDIDYERIGILLNYENGEKQDICRCCETQVSRIRQTVTGGLAFSITFHGDVLDHIENVPESFQRLQELLGREYESFEGLIRWYDDARAEKQEGYYYPAELEEQLLEAVRWGNVGEAGFLIGKIRNHNKRTLHSGQIQETIPLLEALAATAERITGELPELVDEGVKKRLEAVLPGLSREGLFEETFELLTGLFLDLVSRKKVYDQRNHYALKLQLRNYIEENYTNPQMSLSLVSETFGLSEVYLSRLFKQFFNQNFSKYIETLRMQEGRRLVEEGLFMIHEIAQMTGYNSPQSFRRAYKRVFGCTPRENT